MACHGLCTSEVESLDGDQKGQPASTTLHDKTHEEIREEAVDFSADREDLVRRQVSAERGCSARSREICRPDFLQNAAFQARLLN